MPSGIYQHKSYQGFQKGNKITLGRHWKVKDTSKMKGHSNVKGKHWKVKDTSKISEAMKGNTNGFQKGQISWMKGKRHTETARKKIRDAFSGEKSYLWQGGKSFEPYGLEFNKQLKEKIRQRDNFRCQECFRHQDELYSKNGKKYKLLVHHIDCNKQNNQKNNLISLCRNCHLQTHFNKENWIDYFKEKLFNN